jgi:hypothetical protein
VRIDAELCQRLRHYLPGACRPPLNRNVSHPGEDGENEPDSPGQSIEGSQPDEQDRQNAVANDPDRDRLRRQENRQPRWPILGTPVSRRTAQRIDRAEKTQQAEDEEQTGRKHDKSLCRLEGHTDRRLGLPSGPDQFGGFTGGRQ